MLMSRNRVANSRVIYGSRESFPGKGRGKGKFDSRSSSDCTFRDAVVIGGRVVNVCRDANGRVIDRSDRRVRRGDDQGEDDDGDRFDRRGREFESFKVKHGKSGKHGKHGDA